MIAFDWIRSVDWPWPLEMVIVVGLLWLGMRLADRFFGRRR